MIGKATWTDQWRINHKASLRLKP